MLQCAIESYSVLFCFLHQCVSAGETGVCSEQVRRAYSREVVSGQGTVTIIIPPIWPIDSDKVEMRNDILVRTEPLNNNS